MERKLDSAGRLSIPVEIRNKMHLDPGDMVQLTLSEGKLIVEKRNVRPLCRICQVELKSTDEIKSGLCKACIEDVKERLELIG